MEIRYEKGILISDGSNKLLLDPELTRTPIGIPTIVTHAHSDHTAAMSGDCKSYATDVTQDLFLTSEHKRRARGIQTVNFYEPFEVGNFEVEFIKAGHLFGAAQVIVRKANEAIHFSGDFCPAPLLTVEGADVPKDIDLSILDATYGDEKIEFGNRIESRQRLFVWILSEIGQNRVPIINSAHLGGSQELIKLLNQLSPDLEIYTHPKIAAINEVYERHGIELNYQNLKNTDLEKINFDNSLILLPRASKTIDYIKEKIPQIKDKISRAIVTGQVARFGFSSFEYSSKLSTHASHTELIETALKIQPSQILTYYGYSEELAYSINYRCDIPSMELENCKGLSIPTIKKRSGSNKDHRNYYQNNKNEDIWKDWYEE